MKARFAAFAGTVRLLVRILYCVVPMAIVSVLWLPIVWPIAVILAPGVLWLGWQVTSPRPERGESDNPNADLTGKQKPGKEVNPDPSTLDPVVRPSITTNQRRDFRRWSEAINKLDDATKAREGAAWIASAMVILDRSNG